MAYTVRRQTCEIGVRLALGASPGDVVGMVIRKGMALVSVEWEWAWPRRSY
jgi:hypothetical protein